MENQLTPPENFPSPQAMAYALRELARRAGLANRPGPDETGFESTGVSVHYAPPAEAKPGGPAIVIVPSSVHAWDRLVHLPANGLEFVPIESVLPPGAHVPFQGEVPLLFRGAGFESSRTIAELDGPGVVVFSVDLIATVLFLLCRWEETVIPTRDEHDRMPAAVSVAYRQGFLDRPLVDQYALILREWVRHLLPGWQPRQQRFDVRLSHDIDAVWRFGRLRAMAGSLVRDIFHRRSATRAARTAAAAATEVMSPRRSAYYRGILHLSEISRRYRMPSAFYFMAAEPSANDRGYDPGSRLIRRCIEELRRGGFELGYHAGYQTLGDPARLASEKARLDAILGESRYGGRQHFLRFRVPDTWRDWEKTGLTYDSTLSFADHEGFRCGTCHPYRPFDLEQNRELGLWEVPLIVMDGTLRQYRGLTPEEGRRRILSLADQCRAVEGTFTLLWHNSSLDGEWSGWGEAYESVVGALASRRDLAVGDSLATAAPISDARRFDFQPATEGDCSEMRRCPNQTS